MSDRIEVLRAILTRLRARAAAAQEARQLSQDLTQEDLPEVKRLEIGNKRQQILQIEESRAGEVEADLASLEAHAKAGLKPAETEVFVQAIEIAHSDLNKRERAGEILEYAVLHHPVGTDSRSLIDQAIEQFLKWTRAETFFALTGSGREAAGFSETEERERRSSCRPSPMEISLLRSRLRSDSPLSIELLEMTHDIIQLLRLNQGDAEAELIEELVSPRELETLILNKEQLAHFCDKQFLADMLAKYGRLCLSTSEPTRETARVINLLGALEDLTTSINDLAYLEWSDSHLYSRFEDEEEESASFDDTELAKIKELLTGLTAVLYLAKVYRKLGDKARTLYYSHLFVSYRPSRDLWEGAGVTPPWTENDERELAAWLAQLKGEVRQFPKAFETLSVGEISALNAKEIRESLQNLPTVIAEEMVGRQLVANATLDGVESRLRRELGPAFDRLDKTALQCFVTAAVAQSLPDGCDFSCASNLYWKGLEIQIRERVFRSLRNTHPAVRPPVSEPRSLEDTLSMYLSGRHAARAEKAMTLMPMLILLKKALNESEAQNNEALSRLRDFLQGEHPQVLSRPERVDFGRLERQQEDLRNAGVHTRAITRRDCLTSKEAVFGFINALWSASPH